MTTLDKYLVDISFNQKIHYRDFYLAPTVEDALLNCLETWDIYNDPELDMCNEAHEIIEWAKKKNITLQYKKGY
jgi:hypothetical protein